MTNSTDNGLIARGTSRLGVTDGVDDTEEDMDTEDVTDELRDCDDTLEREGVGDEVNETDGLPDCGANDVPVTDGVTTEESL
jgi:hypothetical protein